MTQGGASCVVAIGSSRETLRLEAQAAWQAAAALAPRPFGSVPCNAVAHRLADCRGAGRA